MHSVQPAVKMNEYINKNVFSFFFLFFMNSVRRLEFVFAMTF